LNEFDSDGQITRQTILAKKQVQYRYGYNGNGYVTSYFDGNKNHNYTYDFANRLESWNNGTSTVTYSYDKAGNLLNPAGQALTFNASNEVKSFEYDLEGNLIKDARLSYAWDGLGQLVKTTDNDGNTIDYEYHPDGLRKSKIVGSKNFNYHYDGTDLIRITDNQNNTIWAFTWHNGKLISVTNAAEEEFEAITNYRGDVVQLLDATGETVASYEYDPWGNLISEEPTDSRIQGQPIRYAGYVYDTETKLYYLQARYYDPATARFISRDPDVGNEDDPLSMNGYVYGDDNPVMMTDPDGKWVWVVVNAGFAIYDGYKAYKSGKNKKQIAWAVASSYIGIGHVKRVYRVAKIVKSKPLQNHHFATNKSKKYTPQIESITKKYGLSLNGSWNKELLPHQGRHPNEYHDYVLSQLRNFDRQAKGNKKIFLTLFEGLKKKVRNNPSMMYKEYWRGK